MREQKVMRECREEKKEGKQQSLFDLTGQQYGVNKKIWEE